MDQGFLNWDGVDDNFYNTQYGGNIDPYSGYRFQYPSRNLRGNGIWSTIKGGIMPILRSLLPYLGNTALDAAGGLVSEMTSGKSFKEAAKKTMKKTAKGIALDVANKLDQEGTGTRKKGRKRRRKRIKKVKKSFKKMDPNIVAVRNKRRKKGKRKSIRRTKRQKKRKAVNSSIFNYANA